MLFQISTFVIKHLLLRFTSKKLTPPDMVADLRAKVKEQDEYIKYQTNKIIELQNMVLNAKR